MKIKLYKQQKKILKQLAKQFKTHTKVLFNASCSSGKTIMTLFFIKFMIRINPNWRCAISTYARKEIRDQWIQKIFLYEIIDQSLIQVICSIGDAKELRKRNINAVTNRNISQTIPVTIFIPQSVGVSDIGIIDCFIIDEAHENLDVIDGVLDSVIKSFSHKETTILGLTGTGFDLMNSYFKDAGLVIYDMQQAIDDGLVLDCKLSLQYIDVSLRRNNYTNKEINESGMNIIHKSSSTYKGMANAIRKSRGSKILVITPNCTIADNVYEYINNNIGPCLLKTTSVDNPHAKDVKFRTIDKYKYMVVVGMCGTGWDYSKLDTVIDLTFTKNPKVIIQRLSRIIRLHENVKKPVYVYCADSTRTRVDAEFYLMQALELTKRENIVDYDGSVYLKNITKQPGAQAANNNTDYYDLGYINNYFNITVNSTHTILRSNMSNIRYTGAARFLPLFKTIKLAKDKGMDLDLILDQMLKNCKNGDVVEIFNEAKRILPNEWREANGVI